MSQTPQTLQRGRVLHTAGVEVYGVETEETSEAVGIPFYMVRVGLLRNVELGVRSTVGVTNFGLDLKLQLVDTELIDLAVAPEVDFGWFAVSGGLPLLVGINLSSNFQLIVTGRFRYVAGLTNTFAENDLDFDRPLSHDPSAYLGAGAAVYIRFSEGFGIIPEFQVTSGLAGGTPTLFAGGVGLLFGLQPGIATRAGADELRAEDMQFPRNDGPPHIVPTGRVGTPEGYMGLESNTAPEPNTGESR